MTPILESIIISSVLVFVAVILLWIDFLRTGKASWIDVVWSYGFLVVIMVLNIRFGFNHPRTILISLMMGLWSLRLGTYLFVRVKKETEDGRYAELKKKWSQALNLNFLIFFLFQAISVILLSSPAFIAFADRSNELNILHYVAFGIWVVSFTMESLADHQLHQFKSNPHNKGTVCNIGLWRYSRHPNYFFEWLMWVSYALFALSSSYGFLAIVSPLLILYFLFKVTGIPATEEQSLRTKGDSYRQYQLETSCFVPWPPKITKGSSHVTL